MEVEGKASHDRKTVLTVLLKKGDKIRQFDSDENSFLLLCSLFYSSFHDYF
jgi:hypothetical protein